MKEHTLRLIKPDDFSLTIFEAYCKEHPILTYELAMEYYKTIPEGHKVRGLIEKQVLKKMHETYAMPSDVKCVEDLKYFLGDFE